MMFAGTSGFGYSAGYQTLDLSANAAAIATGNQGFQLTGWLGGWTSQGDTRSCWSASWTPTHELDVAPAGSGPAADRNDTTGLYYAQAAVSCPPPPPR